MGTKTPVCSGCLNLKKYKKCHFKWEGKKECAHYTIDGINFGYINRDHLSKVIEFCRSLDSMRLKYI